MERYLKYSGILYVLGSIAFFINKMRGIIKSYSTPRPFSMSNIEKNVNYVLRVVNRWQTVAQDYFMEESPFYNKHVLEIGPGPDLGTGIILLAMGAQSYQAIDLFPLALSTPQIFYDILFDKISKFPFAARAKEIFKRYLKEKYIDEFSYRTVTFPYLTELSHKIYDVIVSQAVWEHIADPESTLESLQRYAGKNAIFLNEVDLSTHTRIIKDIDPLNILRYSDKIYNKLAYPGIPNRWRASDYSALSERIGLKEVKILPIKSCSKRYINQLRPNLSSRFKEKSDDDLAILSCYWLARFP